MTQVLEEFEAPADLGVWTSLWRIRMQWDFFPTLFTLQKNDLSAFEGCLFPNLPCSSSALLHHLVLDSLAWIDHYFRGQRSILVSQLYHAGRNSDDVQQVALNHLDNYDFVWGKRKEKDQLLWPISAQFLVCLWAHCFVCSWWFLLFLFVCILCFLFLYVFFYIRGFKVQVCCLISFPCIRHFVYSSPSRRIKYRVTIKSSVLVSSHWVVLKEFQSDPISHLEPGLCLCQRQIYHGWRV